MIEDRTGERKMKREKRYKEPGQSQRRGRSFEKQRLNPYCPNHRREGEPQKVEIKTSQPMNAKTQEYPRMPNVPREQPAKKRKCTNAKTPS
jgi:hypothetical protein